jgi:hypothetical protein
MADGFQVVDLDVAEAEALRDALNEALKKTVSANGEEGPEFARLFITPPNALKFTEPLR